MRLTVRVGNEERLQSAVSFKILASDSIKPNKLRFHLQTTHPVASFSKSQKGLCTWNTTGWNFDVSTKVSHGNKEQIAELRNMYSTFNSGLELQIMLLSTHTTQYVLQRILGQFWINLAAMTLCMLTNSTTTCFELATTVHPWPKLMGIVVFTTICQGKLTHKTWFLQK